MDRSLDAPRIVERKEVSRSYRAEVSRFAANLGIPNEARTEMRKLVGSVAHWSSGLVATVESKAAPKVEADAGTKEAPADPTAALHSASELAMSALATANKYVTDAEPWHMKEGDPRRLVVVRSLLEAIYACAHFLQPVLVEAAPKVFEKLGAPPRPISQLSPGYDNLAPGTRTVKGDVLYAKAQTADMMARMEAAWPLCASLARYSSLK